MGDVIEIFDTGKGPFEVEGTDPRGAYEQYENALDDLVKFGKIEEGVRKGEYNHDLPNIAKKESKFITGKRRWVDGKIETYDNDKDLANTLENARPDDKPTLYPTIRTGLQRRQVELQRAGSQSLESIISSTPDDKLEGLMKYLRPVDGLGDQYKRISELHTRVKSIRRLLELYENGEDGKPLSDNTKENVIRNMKDIVEEYYRTHPDYLESSEIKDVQELDKKGNTITTQDRILKIKSDKAVALGLILETLKYNSGFVLDKIHKIYREDSKKLEGELKGNVPGYVRASLMRWKDIKENRERGLPDGEKYVHSLYQQLFQEKYEKNKE